MSRLLLYRPRTIEFKGFIASIEQYYSKFCPETFNHNSLNLTSTKICDVASIYLRTDVLYQATAFSEVSNYNIFTKLGLHLDFRKIPNYILNIMDIYKESSGVIMGAIQSKQLDTLYRFKSRIIPLYLAAVEIRSIPDTRFIRILLHSVLSGPKSNSISKWTSHMKNQLEIIVKRLFPSPNRIFYVQSLLRYLHKYH